MNSGPTRVFRPLSGVRVCVGVRTPFAATRLCRTQIGVRSSQDGFCSFNDESLPKSGEGFVLSVVVYGV